MKNFIKYILQSVLGFKRYLYVFSKHKIRTLKKDDKEKDFFKFLSLLKGEGSILDVGANIGIMSVHISKQFPKTKIHAFEPMPDNLDVLKRILNKYECNNVALHEIAVGNEEGEITMVLPQNGKVKMQGLAHVVHDSITEWNEGETIKAPIKKIDDVIGSEKIEGIKIDVENFEYFALLGAKGILERDHPVVYAELWDNDNRTNCFNLLSDLGYTTYIVENNELVKFDPSTHTKQNFIFLV